MGKNSQLEDLLQNRDKSGGDQRELALFDRSESPILRSLADKGVDVKSKRGRPKGVKNRARAQLLTLIQHRMGADPLMALADVASLTIQDLAKLLECKPLEAFKEWKHLTLELAAFGHGKPKQRVEVTDGNGAPVPMFHFDFTAQAAAQNMQSFGFGQDIEFIDNSASQDFQVTDSKVTDDNDGDLDA